MNSALLIFSLRGAPNYVNGGDFEDSDLKTLDAATVALSLEGSTVGDEGILSMPFLTSLRCIDLDSTKITDKSLEVLAKFPALEELWLECTHVTDTGIKALHLNKALRFVSVAYTHVSTNGIALLKNALPAVEVSA